jgi:hypothetical protein
MGETLTAEEVRSEAVAAMGAQLGEIYHSLSDQVSWLHLKWDTFCELFADRDTVDLLNSAAPAYFHELQRQTWEDLLLHLCRVTDPPLSAGKSNLTLRRLPDLVSDQLLRVNLQALVDDAVQKTTFARDWRNRRLAHTELLRSQPLASASRKHVEDALTAIRLVMNQLEQPYLNKTVSYEHTIPDLGGVASLIAVLRKGVGLAVQNAKLNFADTLSHNKSLDASGGSVFCKMIAPATLE